MQRAFVVGTEASLGRGRGDTTARGCWNVNKLVYIRILTESSLLNGRAATSAFRRIRIRSGLCMKQNAAELTSLDV